MSSFRRRLMMAQGEGGVSDLEPYIYTTTRTNQLVMIIYQKQYAKRIYLEDGTELDVNGSGSLGYVFPEIGDHKVWIEFKKDVTDFSYCFQACSELTSIPENLFANNTAVTNFYGCFQACSGLTSIPENLFANNTAVTDFSYCFGNCYSLTSIPANLFANNTAVTNFYGCFYHCHNLTSSCPIDNDGTPIYNRSSGKSGYSIVTSYKYCFYNCTDMADYASISSDWK